MNNITSFHHLAPPPLQYQPNPPLPPPVPTWKQTASPPLPPSDIPSEHPVLRTKGKNEGLYRSPFPERRPGFMKHILRDYNYTAPIKAYKTINPEYENYINIIDRNIISINEELNEINNKQLDISGISILNIYLVEYLQNKKKIGNKEPLSLLDWLNMNVNMFLKEQIKYLNKYQKAILQEKGEFLRKIKMLDRANNDRSNNIINYEILDGKIFYKRQMINKPIHKDYSIIDERPLIEEEAFGKKKRKTKKQKKQKNKKTKKQKNKKTKKQKNKKQKNKKTKKTKK
jgi:hypothetical protein